MPERSTFTNRVAVLAAVGISPADLEPLRRAWKTFGILVRIIAYEGVRSLKAEPINAFVVRLNPGVRPILKTIRSIDSFQHTLIYAVGEETEIADMAEFEISVLMPDLSADSATEAIQNTYELLMNQMRRHARLPIVIPVKVVVGAFMLNAVSRNISAGGIRVSLVEPAAAQMVALQPDKVSQISFVAPHATRFHLPSTLVRKSKHSAGFQFLGSPGQEELKNWIDQHLQK